MGTTKLYVVSIPIGNLAELSLLGKKILQETELVICEDTRNTKNFFQLNGWDYQKVTFISYHKYNETMRLNQICQQLKKYGHGVLVSDAGYPGICDPGSRLINACRQNEITVQIINGPCALIHCLVASGWSENPFLFGGFCSHATQQIQKQLKKYCQMEGIIAFYVSVHTLENFITSVEKIFGRDCQICIGRELTKKYEEILIGKIGDLKGKIKSKGEFVILINNTSPNENTTLKAKLEIVSELTAMGINSRMACKFLNKYFFKNSTNQLYQALSHTKNDFKKKND